MSDAKVAAICRAGPPPPTTSMAGWAPSLPPPARHVDLPSLTPPSVSFCEGRPTMAEAIGAGGQRIKFAARRDGVLLLPQPTPMPLGQLSALMSRLEASGMVPILDDGLVGGNCAVVAACCAIEGSAVAAGTAGQQGAAGAAADGSGASTGSGTGGGGILISRSGKQPHALLQAEDWVLLTSFDFLEWSAAFESANEGARPSSDAPLHAAALGLGAAERYGWAAAPLVAVHGHALADGEGKSQGFVLPEGVLGCASAAVPAHPPVHPSWGTPRPAGLERARKHGLPISERETLFSTPADLAELEALFRCA